MEPKRFYRSSSDKKIAGVAGGLGEYFDLDPMLVRLLFVILAFAGGGGVLIYLILWIVTPEKPFDYNPLQNHSTMENQQNPTGDQNPQSVNPPDKPNYPSHRSRGNLIGALVLITLGILFLLDEFVPRINFGDLWPILLIVIGIGLLINSIGRRRS
jgi:phage shock protein PspC (stress-responsive transcriptional regulator)